MNMSILTLVSYPYRENPVLRKEAKTLVEHDITIKVIAWDRKLQYKKQEIVDGIPIENIAIQGTYGIRGLRTIISTLLFWKTAVKKIIQNRDKFDLIHCQDVNTLPPGLLAAKQLKKPILFDAHDPYPEMITLTQPRIVVKFAALLERSLCRRVDAILTVNKLMKQRFQQVTQTPVHVVYNYPELSVFKRKMSTPKKDTREVVIGRIGTIQPHVVGIEDTITAFNHIKNKQKLKLLFVGKIAESMKPDFFSSVSHLQEQIELVEDVPYYEVPAYYEKMDISMVLYSTSGIAPFITPMKLLESMAMGVPVIATDIGEIREIVEKYQCGIVVKPHHIQDIVQALETLISNPDLRNRMGKNGFHAIQNELNWEREKKKLLHVYQSILTQVSKY